jgi:hypothetical protein
MQGVGGGPSDYPAKPGMFTDVALLGRAVPVPHTEKGLRAVGRDPKPLSPDSVERYLASKFGQALPMVRPAGPAGESGWGAKGTLSLKNIQQRARGI